MIKSFSEFVNEARITSSMGDGAAFASILKEYLGKREEGKNRGEMVTKFLKSTGLGPGYPWCMAFVYFVFNEFCTRRGRINPLPKTAAVLNFWEKSPIENKFTTEEAQRNPSLIKAGQIFVKKRSGGGHTGIVLKLQGDSFISIDGNSSDMVKLNTYKISDVRGFVDYFANPVFSAELASIADQMIRSFAPTKGGGKED